MNKKIMIIAALAFLAAGCSVFSQTVPTGVVKSVDGGADWQFSNSVASSTTASLASLSISKLAFDPNNRQTLFAGSYTDGLFESNDSGASWSKILSKIFVYDFAVNPFDSKTIYAAGLCVDRGCVLKTTDGGGSWTDNAPGYTASVTATPNPVRAVAVSDTNPNQLVIGTADGSVIKSADGGLSWQLAKSFGDQINRILWQNGTIYVLLKTQGLFTSSDFGVTFTDATASLSKTYSLLGQTYNQNSVGTFSQVYADTQAPGLIYITTDKGLYKTVDAGATWTLENLPLKPSSAAAHAVTVAQSNSNIVFTSVGSTIYKSLDGGTTWQTQGITTGGFINYILDDPQLPQIVYAGIYANQ